MWELKKPTSALYLNIQLQLHIVNVNFSTVLHIVFILISAQSLILKKLLHASSTSSSLDINYLHSICNVTETNLGELFMSPLKYKHISCAKRISSIVWTSLKALLWSNTFANPSATRPPTVSDSINSSGFSSMGALSNKFISNSISGFLITTSSSPMTDAGLFGGTCTVVDISLELLAL